MVIKLIISILIFQRKVALFLWNSEVPVSSSTLNTFSLIFFSQGPRKALGAGMKNVLLEKKKHSFGTQGRAVKRTCILRQLIIILRKIIT